MTGTVVVEQKQVPLRARVVHRKIAVARKVAVGLGRGATLRVHCGDRARKVIRQPAAAKTCFLVRLGCQEFHKSTGG